MPHSVHWYHVCRDCGWKCTNEEYKHLPEVPIGKAGRTFTTCQSCGSTELCIVEETSLPEAGMAVLKAS